MQGFAQVTISGLATGSLYGLLGLGLVLIYRTTGVLNFAYSAISSLCACFLYEITLSYHLNFWLALFLSLIFAFILGAVLERLFARPVLNAPIFTKAIATLALALVLRTLAQAIWPLLAQSEPFSTPFENAGVRLGGVYISAASFMTFGATVVVVALLNYFLNRTRLGIAMRASADNQPVAQLMGAPVSWIFLLTWALASVIGALAAILLASQQRLVDITYMDPVLLLAFVAAVLGGLESLPGALIGGIIVGVVENWLALFLAGHQLGPIDFGNPGIRDTLIFAAFIIVLLVRPQGLLGKALLRRV